MIQSLPAHAISLVHDGFIPSQPKEHAKWHQRPHEIPFLGITPTNSQSARAGPNHHRAGAVIYGTKRDSCHSGCADGTLDHGPGQSQFMAVYLDWGGRTSSYDAESVVEGARGGVRRWDVLLKDQHRCSETHDKGRRCKC